MKSPSIHHRKYVRIVGMGAVTPFGMGVEVFWKSILAGRDAFDEIRLFQHESHRTHVAAEISGIPYFEYPHLREKDLSRADRLGLAASREALLAAKLINPSTGIVFDPKGMAVVVGTAAGGIRGLETFFRERVMNQDVQDPFPLLSSFCLSALATNIARAFGISGPRKTLATVCSSSGLALAAAKELLEIEPLDYVLVVGAETLSEVTLAGFNSLRSVAPDRCQPFDLNRKGLILGEGAGAMVLERNGAKPLCPVAPMAFFSGYGLTTDLHHFTAPQPQGEAVAETIRAAMTDAGVRVSEIDYINAHGTATGLNDVAETRGIKSALGDYARRIPVSSIKSMIGHALGAASILEAIATVMSLKYGIIPPTANLETQDPECDLNYTPRKSIRGDLKCAVSNSFAFGGSNISLIFHKTAPSEGIERFSPDIDDPSVITGIGLVTPLGIGKAAFRDAVDSGKDGLVTLGPIGEKWIGFKGGRVDTNAVRERIPSKIRRHLNPLALFVYAALQEAMEDAGVDKVKKEQPFVYGSAFGCSENVHRFYSQLLTDGPRFTSPRDFNLSVANAPPSLVAQNMGIKGPIWVFVADEASWDMSVGWAIQQIRLGRTQQIAVCAAEEISASVLNIHQAIGMLGDETRPGLSLGEGAVCMILESKRVAEARQANIYGTLKNWHTVQDTGCGPLEYSRKNDYLFEAAVKCLRGGNTGKDDLELSSAENGMPVVEETMRQVIKRISGFQGQRICKHALRKRIGESGFAGGAGLASILVNPNVMPDTFILALTCARGGVNTATLVQNGKFFGKI